MKKANTPPRKPNLWQTPSTKGFRVSALTTSMGQMSHTSLTEGTSVDGRMVVVAVGYA